MLRTDEFGRIRADALAVGAVILEVRRLGFRPARVPARLGAGENALVVHLSGASAVLDPVRIVANRKVSARLEDFEIRLAHGEASAAIGREEIEKRDPVKLSQLLRRLPGIRIADSLGSIVAVSNRGNKMTLTPGTNVNALVQCVLRVAVDGTIMPALTNLDAIVPRDVHGIELFLGPARMPLQFAGVRTDNWCGLIAIWTRDGG